ncbi:Sickle tail protein [Actinidia chinensis var. chinensis]|uniref:Sickle tail protein n=1 Tax=Actinidia chinensis var. chinensis TaxID=1590841 RepID=A0A2R6RSC3_ACTCC|nr:Sickle tail protein [Actinidia chinensis var. chinensis]
MMGLGSFVNGGSSSSSSNLSALAPPFTVDRSNPKPNSNPLANFTEPPYAVPFHSAFPNWQYSHPSASRPDLFYNMESELDSIRTTGLPTANDYGYLGSLSVSSPSAHMPPLSPNVSSATDRFTFLQYSSAIPSNCVEPKEYYPPLVPPVVDDAIPLVALNEPSYDLLSTSRVGPLGGTSQVDYTQSLSGLEYTPPWGSFWNRLADEEQGKRVGRDGNFRLEEKSDAGIYSHKYMKQGACTAEGPGICEEVSAISHRKCVDDLGRERQILSPITGKLNDKPPSLQDPMLISSASQRTSISGLSSTLQESHAQVPSPESATSFWNHQMLYNASYDMCFQSLGSSMKDRISVKKSSPALVIRPPPSVGTSSTKTKPVSSADVSSIGNVAAINIKDFVCHSPSNQKEPLLPLGYGKERCSDTSQPSLLMVRSDHVFVAPSSTRKEVLSNNKDGLDHISKAEKEIQPPAINVPDGFTLALDMAKGFTSFENSSDISDSHNPAEDSPCWKGAPTSHFSPSKAAEAITPQNVMKKLEECNSFYFQQTQISPHCADDTVKENSVHQENGYVELGSLLCPERVSSNADCPTGEHSSADSVKAGLDYLKSCSSNGVQFSNDIDKGSKEYVMPNDSKSDSDLEPPPTKKLDLDKDDGTVPLHGVESTSCLPCSAEIINKLGTLYATESTPKMNVQMLVDTIRNLSELLLFQCSNDASAVSRRDLEVLQHIINNLGVCVSKKNVSMTPTRESRFTQQFSSHECQNLPDLLKGFTAGRPSVTKESGARPHGQLDDHSIHEERRNMISGKEVEKFPDFASPRDDADIVKDDNMVQALKEVLKKDFDGEEEMQAETLLYKNLWLEAEAALCSVSYRARFNRMKIEMEKCKTHKAKDVTESTKAVEKLLNSKVSPDSNVTNKATPEAKDIPLSNNNLQDSPISSLTTLVDDVEATALARFHILKCRDENSNSVSTDAQRLTEVAGTGFACKRNHDPFIGDLSEGSSLDVSVGYLSGNNSSKVDSKVSPDSNATHKATPEAKDFPFSDNNLQDSPISSSTALDDDVEATALARFHILKCRDENSNSVSTEGRQLAEVAGAGFAGKRNHGRFIGDLTEGSSLDVYVGYFSGNNSSKVDSKVSPDSNATHKATPEAKDIPLSDNSLQDSPISSSTMLLDDIDSSALARFHILKCRDENSNSVSTEGRQLAEVAGAGFAGKRNHGRFIGDLTEGSSLDVFVGPYSQYFSGNNSKVDGCGPYTIPRDHETMKDFHVCATDDQVIQSCRKNGLGNRFPSGWCDSSSSEWEHVLKDEFAYQN